MRRGELSLPLAWALIGAAWGICWGMVHHQSPIDRTRVTLDHSVPLALAGFVGGAALGGMLHLLGAAWPPLGRALAVLAVPALAASAFAPVGWVFRDSRVDWSGEAAMLRAAAGGLVVGLALCVAARFQRGRAGVFPEAVSANRNSPNSADW